MIDPSLMPELPVMPNPKLYPPGPYPDGVLTYSADQMNAYAKAYGLQCYQLAMERAAPIAYDAAIRYSQGYAVDFKAEFALQEKTT